MQYLFLISLVTCAASERKFPKNFQFGVTSSAYQYEGAWDEDGKGTSIWDVAAHQNPSHILNDSTGDVSADMYHRYKEDVKLISYLGLDFFRFSISWSRILPTGFVNDINRAGIEYYNNFIDELIQRDITPCATIYHWDLPQTLQQLGGWANPYAVEWFEDYAKVVFDNFGDKVKIWTTINEPVLICSYGYDKMLLAPFVNSLGVGEYMCVKNVLLAHARAYRLYHRNYNDDNEGKVGISINPYWTLPLTSSEKDQQAAFNAFQFSFAIVVTPIFSKQGDYPEAVKSRALAESLKQGFLRSRLQNLTEEEIEVIKGSADFLGINHYYTKFVTKNSTVFNSYYSEPLFTVFQEQILDRNHSFDPAHLYEILMTVKQLYNNPTVYITENGWSENDKGLEDDDRVEYLAGHIDAMLEAVDQGCDVRGYSVWSLMDNFEWALGYTKKFGLYEVDFSSANLTRTPRKSAHFYKRIIESRTIKRDKAIS